MSVYEKISGFADEISQDFDQQLKTVTDLGMKYICIRSVEHKALPITPPRKCAPFFCRSCGPQAWAFPAWVRPSARWRWTMKRLCQAAGAAGNTLRNGQAPELFLHPDVQLPHPKDADADRYTDVVLDKLRQFIRIAEKHDVVLLHENEKGIYGDTGARCKLLFDRLACPHFKAAFDFANFVQCEQDTAECWELLHDQIAYIHIKDALPGCLLNVPAGTGLGKIPELLRRAFCEEGYHGFLTLEPHLAMFDFFAPGAKGGESQKLQFENNPIIEKMKSEMAEPGRPKDGAEAYATQYHALVEILNPILN